MLNVSKVNRLKQVMCATVLAVWASCTIHCEIEVLTSTPASSCCKSADESGGEQHGQHGPSDQCVCTVIASGGYIIQKDVSLIPPSPDTLAVLSVSPQHEDAPAQSVVEKLIYAPPELPKIWQFFLRTALAPRAPSFVS